MQLSLAILSKKAIEAALKANWAEAICLNQQILEKNPENLETKIRLGRAYIQTKKFDTRPLLTYSNHALKYIRI